MHRTAALLILLLAWSGAASAKVFVTVDEALRLAFPGCEVVRRTAYLTPAQVQQAKDLSGVEVPSALVAYHEARRNGHLVGTAYFDTHRVRTLPETLLIVIDPQGRVARLEVISFREPEEYMPRGAWYGQFKGHRLDRDLALKTGIHPVSGATLTARATTSAVRRVLALHQVIGPK
ncbi:MAG TPA: FMN-binding protein [Thermoanaerobaculia bacterium]|jgi:Na+-translocating ferredoxin:NAD+ oxidoreductase RnfG subunit|nr:FMN-binding protein [Thermoanaerobaculia bacterium]